MGRLTFPAGRGSGGKKKNNIRGDNWVGENKRIRTRHEIEVPSEVLLLKNRSLGHTGLVETSKGGTKR